MAWFICRPNRLLRCRRVITMNAHDSIWQASYDSLPSKILRYGFCNISSAVPHGEATKSGEEAEILRIVKSEMVHVRDTYKSQKAAKKRIPNITPFSVKDHPGSRQLLLHRTYRNENICISCVYKPLRGIRPVSHECVEDDEYDQAKCEGQLQMKVAISKGLNDSTLEMDCTFFGKDLYFERIVCGDALDKKRHCYAGPHTQKEAEELQCQFEQFLAVRGVTLQFALEVVKEMANKDDREYFRWLKNMRLFFKE